tara:strand:- start:907 stop:1461 length:555 start_codon:yes stop_codon:yes gene_type:complete
MLEHTTYIKIDANGDRVGDSIIDKNNIFHIMDQTSDFTDEELTAAGYASVIDSIRAYNNGDSAVDIEPGDIIKNADGTFTQQWIETEIDAAEKRLRFLEVTRGFYLVNSDWTQMSDSPLNDATKALYATYRQELRDLPANITWSEIKGADDIDWPVVPGAVEPAASIAAAANTFITEDSVDHSD